jgi:predicted TIM-barrel fold metal-dependent hydrolase
MSAHIKAITLEEHAAFPSLGCSGPFYDMIWKVFPAQHDRAWDHSTHRLADMDAGGIQYQILSHLCGIYLTDPARCRLANDQMATAIAAHPSRFGGFAALPMAHPDAAAAELERAVRVHGLVGALIDNSLADGTHYDAERFWPVFAAAERLDVPLYLHPAPPADAALGGRFRGNYPPPVQMGLATGAWGWHEDVGLHVLKLYAAGVFERFPRLKIVVGHMGELLPIMLHRVARMPFFRDMEAGRAKGILDVWDQNIWVTTSGIFSVETLMMVLQVTKVERVMFSIDYPFEDGKTGRDFLDRIERSGKLTTEELEKIAFKNARDFLKLDLP